MQTNERRVKANERPVQMSKDESKTNERRVQRNERRVQMGADEWETSVIQSFMNSESPTVLMIMPSKSGVGVMN